MNIEGSEEKQPLVNLVCFNPQCPFPRHRFFSNPSNHSSSERCRRWFHKVDELVNYDKYLLSNLKATTGGVLIDFANQPVEALKKLASLTRMNWKHTVSLMFNEIRNQMCTQLEISEKMMVQELDKHLKSAAVYDNIIKILANGSSNSEIVSKDITECLQKHRIPTESILMFSYRTIDQAVIQIKEALSRMNQKFWNMGIEGEDQCQTVSEQTEKTDGQQQLKKFESWINEDVQNPFSKVQVLAASFSIIPSTYTSNGKSIGLECFLCKQNITVSDNNNKKNAKKQATKLVLEHLISLHQKEIFLNYRKKISKSYVREYTMDQIIDDIKTQGIKKVQIIDRENSGTYTAQENGQFIFEVVSQRNISLARGNFVVAKSISKDAADIVISFIIKELFNVKNMTVRLVTNDHFGTTIQEICGCLGYDFKVISRIKR